MNSLKNNKRIKKVRKVKRTKKNVRKYKSKKNVRKVKKSKKNIRKYKSRRQKGGNYFNFHKSPHMLPISNFGVTPGGIKLPENSNILYDLGQNQNGGGVNLGYFDHVTNGVDYLKYGFHNQIDNFLGNSESRVVSFPYNQSM